MASLEQQNAGGNGGGITQLDFHQAMRDFKTMFPEMDEDVIEVVLRANNGAVDATIDQLLAMNADAENQRRPNKPDTGNLLLDEVPPCYEPGRGGGATPPPSYQQASQLVANDLTSSPHFTRSESTNNRSTDHLIVHKFPCASANVYSPSSESLRAKFRWNPPMLGPLPSTFLRLDGYNQTIITRKVSNATSERRSNDVLSSALLQQVIVRLLLSCQNLLTQLNFRKWKKTSASVECPTAQWTRRSISFLRMNA